MTPTQVIALLNAMTCGDLDSVSTRLEEARAACVGMGAGDLAGKLGEAREALLGGDLKIYRKRVETVVAGLGHVRSKHKTPSGPGAG